MVYQITFKDGTVAVVERCWLVESRPRPGKPMHDGVWAVQRHTGTKLRWHKEEDIVDAKYAAADVEVFTPPRKAG